MILKRYKEINFKKSAPLARHLSQPQQSSCGLANWCFLSPVSLLLDSVLHLKGSRWAIPSDARLCRGAPPRCAHRDGVDAESGTGRRVTFWHCKGRIPNQLRQRPSSCGAPRPQASFLVSQPARVGLCVCACSAAVPCCTGRLSILVRRRAKRIGQILHLLHWRGCLSLSVPRLRGTNAAGPSATSLLHQSRVVFAFFFYVMLRCFAHVKGEWDRLASSWVAISGIPHQLSSYLINGSFGTIADICNYRRNEAVVFTRQLLVLPFEGPGWADSTPVSKLHQQFRVLIFMNRTFRHGCFHVMAVAVLVKMVRFHVRSFCIPRICQQGYTKDVLIVIYLHDLNSVIKMSDLSGFQRISQHLNESAPLWRYVIGVHTAQRGAMYSVIVFPLWPSIGTVHRGGASCSLHGIRFMCSFKSFIQSAERHPGSPASDMFVPFTADPPSCSSARAEIMPGFFTRFFLFTHETPQPRTRKSPQPRDVADDRRVCCGAVRGAE